MTRIPTRPLVLILAAGLALSACGRMADLEAPPARQTERAPRDAGADALPDPATQNRSSNQIPIDGGPNNPYRGSGNPFSGQ
jgi:predicted small lipoprotein YifL